MEQLFTKLDVAGIVRNDVIILDSFQAVAVVDFADLFGSTDGSYEALVAADSNSDGTNKGYTRFFDAWRDAGII